MTLQLKEAMSDIAAPWRAIHMTEATRKKREYVDFASVPPSQWAMHDRLENWARASRGGDKQSGAASPMFQLYRSTDAKRAYGEETSVPVNKADAIVVGKRVVALPDRNRGVLNWYYIHRCRKASDQAEGLRITLLQLSQLVRDSREMLIVAEQGPLLGNWDAIPGVPPSA